MIKRAFLVRDPFVPDLVVAGLTVRTRQALSLRDARLAVVEVDAAGAAGAMDEDALVARTGCVWHPALVKRLARMTIAPDAITAVGSSGGALFMCGKGRTRSFVADLARGPHSREGSTAIALQPPEFIVPVSTDEDRRAALTLLLSSLEKPTDGIASRHVHRPISRQITRLVLPWAVTPNAMTVFAALFGVAGVAAAWRGGYRNLLAGAALFWIQNVLDGCDGEIARLKYLHSRSGEWLDQVIDDVLNIAFLAAVGLALARDGSSIAWWLTCAAVGSQIVHLIGLYAALLFRAGGRGSVATLRWFVGDPSENRTLGNLTRRDVLSLAYLIAALFNAIVVIFVYHTLLTVGAAVVTTLQWAVWGGPRVQTEGDGGAERAGEATA